MASCKVFVAVLAALIAVAICGKGNLKTILMGNPEWKEACLAETGFKTDDPDSVWIAMDSSVPEGRCFMGCMLEKATVIENGKYSAANSKKLAEECVEGEVLEKLKAVLDECDAEVTTTDRCESGPLFGQCIKKKKSAASLEL